MSKPSRIIIYPQDIAIITGKSDRYGRNLIHKIKVFFNKEDHHLVTIREFSEYLGIDYHSVLSTLGLDS